MSGWTLAEYQGEDGGAFVVRTRALPPADERARWPVAVWLAWSFGAVSDAEEDAIVDEMIRFESAVYDAAERNGWGLLVAVITTGRGREWLFHAANGTEFLSESGALTEAGGWPALNARVYDDPSWKAARELSTGAGLH